MTLEQKRALALARARMSMSNSDFAAVKAEGPTPRREVSIEPDLGGVVTGLLDAFNKGTDYVGGKLTDTLAPYVPPQAAAVAGAAVNTGLQALPMALGGGPAAKAVPALSSRMELGAALRSQDAVRNATLAAGKDAGYKLPPSEVAPTWLGNQFESIAGKDALKQDAIHANQDLTDTLARRAASLHPNSPISQGTLDAAHARVSQPYRDVESLPGIPPKLIVKNPNTQYPIRYYGPTPQTPAEALHDLKAARLRAKELWEDFNRTGNVLQKDAARTLDSKAAGLEADIDAAAVASGRQDLVDALRESRTANAKIYDVERSLNEGSGSISAPIIGRMVDKNPGRYTGELETIGKFQQAFPQFMGEAEKAGTGGVGKLRWYGAGMLGAGGATAMGPGGVALAAMPFISDAVRAAILSKLGQRLLVNPSYPGDAATNIARLGILGGQEAMMASEKDRREALIRAIKQNSHIPFP